jgi:threonine dehydrogenase-like Zn-dependent dehydrogenase
MEVGAGVDIPLGTRAAVYIGLYCGQCKFCLAGETNRCLQMKGLVGWQTQGGYAQELIVPAKNLIPLPEDISDAEGVLLLDTIGTATYGVEICSQRALSAARSDRAAVVGCGPMGLGSLLSLQAAGWDRVFAHDPAESRLQTAISFGAEPLSSESSANEGKFALVIEAVGHPNARNLALDLVEPGGAVLLLGESDLPWTLPESPKWRRKDCYYVRSFYFPIGAAGKNMEVLRTRREQFHQMIQEVVPLEGLQQAFADFCAGKTLKPLVRPNS